MQFEKIIKYIFPQFVIRRLEGRKNLQKILANTSWLFFDKILRMGVGLFVGAWVARYLGPEQFGLLSYAMVFIALFGAIATLGLDGIVVKELVKYPEKKDFILGSAFALKFLGGWVVLFLSSVCIYLVRPKDTLVHWLVIVISAGTIFQAFDTIDFWFQAQLKSYYTVIAKNSAFVLISIAKIIFIFKKAPLVFFGFAAFFEIVIGSFFMIIAYNHNKLHLKYWKIDWGTIKNLFEQSWPLIFAGIAILIYMKIDQIMLGQMIGDKEVGIYSAAVRISEIWYFIPIVITSSIYPALVKMHQESEEKYYEKLMEIMGYFFWGTLIFSVIFTYFSQSIIYLIYGKDYSAATNVLSIHIYSGIIVSMSVVFSQKFVLDGTTKVSLYGTVVGASSNIFLNLWLIKPYKSQGAAIATLISYVIPVLFQSIFFDRKIGKTFLLSIFWILKSKKKYT